MIEPPLAAAPKRIAALDLIRGVAVLGILTVNIAGFAGPQGSTLTPALPGPGSPADYATFAIVFLLFEGKMRALFSMLFGASMLLFIERADAAGRNGEALQLRRLGWLAGFGYLHFAALWWGDILFVYALCGLAALALRGLSSRSLLIIALVLFCGSALQGAVVDLPRVLAEEHVRTGTATPAEARDVASALATARSYLAQDSAQAHLGFFAMAADKLAISPLWPLVMTMATFCETLPLMLIGMVLFRSGLFAGQWPRARLWAMAWGGLMLGGAQALALCWWAWPRHFPPLAMPSIMAYWAGPEHLLMALAYAALLVLAAPRLLAGWPGQRLAAAGRMAFSNYLGTSAVMCALFYGWGLGLFGRVSHAAQPAFVALGWTLMLGWSAPWLAHFRQGPLEWAWRSLVEGNRLPLRREG